MKPLSEMTRLELAAFIGAEFKRRNIKKLGCAEKVERHAGILKDIHPSISTMRNMIDGTGKLNSQFSSHVERISKKTKHPSTLFLLLGMDVRINADNLSLSYVRVFGTFKA